MEIKNIHTVIKSLVLFSVMTVFASCEEMPFPSCEECYEDAPTEVTIDITLFNKYIAQCDTTPVINIFDGDIDNNILITSFTATSDCLSPSLPVEKKYTFQAYYKINGIIYVAFDSVTPKIKYNKSECEYSCYYIQNKEVNLALKYIE